MRLYSGPGDAGRKRNSASFSTCAAYTLVNGKTAPVSPKHLLPKIAQVTGEKLTKLKDLIRFETEKDGEIKEILKDRILERYYSKKRRRGKKDAPAPAQLDSETLYFRGRTYQPGDKEWAIVEKIISELETD